MAKHRPPLHPDSPLYLNTHQRPVSRRELIAQGFKTGLGTVLGGSAFSLLSRPAFGQISLSTDLQAARDACGISAQGAGKIPFICFDLAGGRSEEHTSELQSRENLVCRLLLEKKK